MSVDAPVRGDGKNNPDTPKGLKKVVAASMAGTVVEWYEFFLYGTAATLVFSKVFFSEDTSELDAILAAFVTYAVGFAARRHGLAATIVVPWNDPSALRAAVAAHELAAILVEPYPGNMGVVPPDDGFLELLREEATAAGALLVQPALSVA